MQSAFKRSEASNIYKLNDFANSDQDASSDASGDSGRKPASAGQSGDEGGQVDNLGTREASADENAGESAEIAPSSADDALAWLKIIQNATADLTADIRASKGDEFARSFADEEAPFESNHPPSPGGYSGSLRRSAGFDDDVRHDTYSDERKLAQKLSFRNAEPRQAPPQSLGTAILPYAAATGILAFLAGSAAVYFLTGSASDDVKAKAAAHTEEIQIGARPARPDQIGAKKSGSQRAAPSAVSGDSASIRGAKPEEQGAKPAEPASAGHQPQTWSDTVETFKQFVRPEQK
jgi:hypothetical protein